MRILAAVEARLNRAGLFDDYPWLILPCRIRTMDNKRNYVIVYNTGERSLAGMHWQDLNLNKGQAIPDRVFNRSFFSIPWSDLIDACKLSENWEAWSLDELYRFNCQDLINDPYSERGLICAPEVLVCS